MAGVSQSSVTVHSFMTLHARPIPPHYSLEDALGLRRDNPATNCPPLLVSGHLREVFAVLESY